MKLVSHNTHGEFYRRRCLQYATVSSTASLRLLSPSCSHRFQETDMRTCINNTVNCISDLIYYRCTAQQRKRSLRVAVAHTHSSHTSKQIQISPPVHIPQPLHVTLVDEHWFLIVGNLHGHGVAILSADLHHPLFGHTLDRDNITQAITKYRKRLCILEDIVLSYRVFLWFEIAWGHIWEVCERVFEG